MGFFQYFTAIILLSAFYSFAITTIVYSLPPQDKNFIIQFNCEGQNDEECIYKGIRDYGETTREFQESLQTQKQFGIIDAGSLALFSGNMLLDLAVNFFFAVPNMFQLFFTGLFSFLHLNFYLQTEILIWIKAILAVVSSIFLFQFLLGARTQSLQVV